MKSNDAKGKKGEIRRLELDFDVPGTPEEVWAAIATGPGVASWFVPASVEERRGGKIVMQFGDDDAATGTITAWEPPRRFAYEEAEWTAPERGASPLATEFTVEARDGGRCVVRVVSSVPSSGEDWEDEFFESMRRGWAPFFENLKLTLREFRGRPCSNIALRGVHPGGAAAAFDALATALGVGGAAPGRRVQAAPGTLALSGEVVRAGDADLLLRLDVPAPGFALLSAFELGGQARVSVQLYLFGDEGQRAADRHASTWQTFMAERFPVPG